MEKGRLLAFSDGVIAILITIMVLELKVPEGGAWHDLHDDLPVLLAYVLSFVYLGIYWNNHHHMLAVIHRVNGAVLWANLHLLFWLSLFPFTTAWMSENDFPTAPVVVYGIVLFAAGMAYFVLQGTLLRSEGEGSVLARAIRNDVKGKATAAAYPVGIALSFLTPWLGVAVYVAVALVWVIPDRRVERLVADPAESVGEPG